MGRIICTGCGGDRAHAARGRCHACYMRWYRSEHPPVSPPLTTCTACGDSRPHAAHGWCQACYRRWVNHGRPQDGPPAKKPLQPCGTDAAYQRHVKLGQPIDDACRDAHNADQKDRRARSRSSSSHRGAWTAEQSSAAYTVALATVGSPADRRMLLEALGLLPYRAADASPTTGLAA